MKDQRLLFVGGLFPPNQRERIEVNSKGHVHYAADALQWNIVNGFDNSFDGCVDILTVPFIGSFPTGYKELYCKKVDFNHTKESNDKLLGFLNLYGIRPWLLYYVFKKGIKEWIEQHDDKKRFIIFYSLQTYFLQLAKWLKAEYPNIHINIVIPDLPAFMDLNKSGSLVYRIKKKRHIKCCEDNINHFDSYTLLTKEMADALRIDSDKCVVVEGIAELRDDNTQVIPNLDLNKNDIAVVYTGTLTRLYGVMDLVNAFKYIPYDNYKLLVCGEGETKEEILQAAKNDNRIIYLGRLRREQALWLQQTATILINPRSNNDDFTKYSFPSKLMEYLASGRPVVCYRLDGIPEEYNAYFQYIDGNTPKAIANKIVQICSLSNEELASLGSRGRSFVLREKNSKAQTKKIVEIMGGGNDYL